MESLKNWRHFDKLHVAWCASGIIGCLLLYGVLQERIMIEPFGEEQERFKFSLFLVLCNRMTSMLIAALGCLVSGIWVTLAFACRFPCFWPRQYFLCGSRYPWRFLHWSGGSIYPPSLPKLYGEGIKPIAPIWNYCAVSVSNVVATFCQYEALKYVSFPVQTLGKCAKMIPVMVWGKFILQKSYKLLDYTVAVVVTVGCTVFILTGDVKSKASSSMELSMAGLFGVMLMLGYLGFDGFTSTFQDRMFKGYSMTIYNQILYITMCSSALSAFGLVSSGQFSQAIDFVTRHPEALHSIVALSVAATTGQLFISYTIRCYGALIFATVMTTRQFLSILLSCALFLHPLSGGQW
mmetsp:Transcript_9296/g.22399  ORF Transcript_9296/g.22399 Transcript_9296/m.22399 type:complete len:350 (-) Transcript_9296:391-1440(-)